MHSRTALLACLLFLVSGEVLAQRYRCELHGKPAFSDQPCKPGEEPTRKDAAPSEARGTLEVNVAIKHYTVRGRDTASLSQSIKANGPKGFHGQTQWNFAYEYTAAKERDACRMRTVRVKADAEILMPQWADEATAPPALQRRWHAYYAALKAHEDGHVRNGKELAPLVKDRLLGLGAMPCDQVKAIADAEFRRLTASLRARDKEYDDRTDHGANQGAEF